MHARNPLHFALCLVIAAAVMAGCGSTTPSSAASGQTCKISTDCPTGQTCTNQICVAKSGLIDKDAVSDSITAGFDTVMPGADVKSDTETDTVTPSDTTAPTDTGSSTALGAACAACKVDADCGDPSFQCLTLLNGTFCAKTCGSAADCPTSFSCGKADTKATSNNCLPPNYSCSGCLVSPCDPGQSCVAATGQCAVVKQQCDACNTQTDCADGLKCVSLGTSKVCAPTCDNGALCPDMSTCQASVVGNICAFEASSCCYGSSCTVASACTSCADKCFGGVCVGCLTDAQCTGGKCDPNAHTCITSGACQAPTPIKLADGTCVECTNDTHCASSTVGPTCDLSTHQCAASTSTNQCSACVAPYPGCVQINGTWSCVECSTDADCAAKSAGTCSGTTYTCSGTVSGGTGPKTGSCKADSDCQNGGTTTFTLACDTASGLCYDTAGGCDNISAFCNAAKGSSCVQPSTIPGLPTGTGTGANPGVGTCSCGSSSAATKSGLCALDPSTTACDCSNPSDPSCTSALFGPCCGGGSSSGLPDFSCLLNTAPAPDCFGSLPCTCGFASLLGGTGGASVPNTCGSSSGGLP